MVAARALRGGGRRGGRGGAGKGSGVAASPAQARQLRTMAARTGGRGATFGQRRWGGAFISMHT
jgi:hypothetical protein